MKYLVDAVVELRLTDITIQIDDFDEDSMALMAVEKWLNTIRNEPGNVDIMSKPELDKWDHRDD